MVLKSPLRRQSKRLSMIPIFCLWSLVLPFLINDSSCNRHPSSWSSMLIQVAHAFPNPVVSTKSKISSAKSSIVWSTSLAALVTNDASSSDPILYRNGRAGDELFIAPVMAKELMNPFGISHKNNLMVAGDKVTGKRVGWAQIRSMGYASVETSIEFQAKVNNQFRRKVQSINRIEQEVDDEIWDDLERDPVEFPNGMASLPWTKEYREASQAAEDRQRLRQERRRKELARRPQLWELSSVYVIPEYRNRGIGSELVQGVLQRTKFVGPGKEVYALTLAKTVPWYQALGFELEPIPPTSMALEIAAGSVITKLIGEELVCIKTTLD